MQSGIDVPLRVLTFNLWGIFNSKKKEARMRFFATKIDHYDVILLQEQFTEADFEVIWSCAPAAVQSSWYHRRFPSSFYGSGCTVLSRYPILQTFFHTFPLQGYPEMILHGDFFANKGVAMTRIAVPIARGDGTLAQQVVTLYTTHLVAVYQKVSQLQSWRNERYLPYRISQAISLAQFIAATSTPGDAVVIGGDFNSSQRSLEVQMMLICLKRRGYDLRSALPSPPPASAMKELTMSAAERRRGQQLHTFSDRNAFNAMKTSYFKLLKMEADIPAQIDHLFFSRESFSLQPFDDCPDVAEGYPSTIDTVPQGLVVFAAREVYAPPTPSRWQRRLRGVTEAMEARWTALSTPAPAATAPCTAVVMLHRALKWLASSAAPVSPSSGGPAPGERAEYYPLSDHYGVAARVALRATQPSPAGGAVLEQQHPTLTEDEAMVVQTVESFLSSHVEKLRKEIKITRWIAGTAVLSLGIQIWGLRYIARQEAARTAVLLEQTYILGREYQASRAAPVAPAAPRSETGAPMSFKEVVSRVSTVLHLSPPERSSAVTAVQLDGRKDGSYFSHDGRSGGANESSAPNAATVQHALQEAGLHEMLHLVSLKPLWATIGMTSIINAVLTVIGTASLAIGMLQRAGNASILEDQVREVSRL